MSLFEIDHVATQRRLETVAASGLRALGETTRRSEEVDEQVRDMVERREREKRAMEERIAAAKPEPTPEPPARPRPKPSTLSLGADEFREVRPAPRRATSKLGAPEDRRPRADDAEEDLSGRTWLR